QWLDEIDDSVGTRVLAALGDTVRAWNEHRRSNAFLWNDPRLELVSTGTEAHPFLLNADETQFVKSSMRQKRRRLARLIGGLSTTTVVLAIFAVLAFAAQRRATAEAELATKSQQLATAEARRANENQELATAQAQRATKSRELATAEAQRANENQQRATA